MWMYLIANGHVLYEIQNCLKYKLNVQNISLPFTGEMYWPLKEDTSMMQNEVSCKSMSTNKCQIFHAVYHV